ncbi:MAG: GNAT family N-acetyltransferase [Actinobacteria bacterium]|nr:GNAT family N-acetyltransferase [Actinomycetota bacterium]
MEFINSKESNLTTGSDDSPVSYNNGITQTINETQLSQAVEIYYEAFKKKIRVLIKSREKVFAIYIEAFKKNNALNKNEVQEKSRSLNDPSINDTSLSNNRVFYSLLDTRVVGLIGLQYENKNFIEFTYDDLRKYFNPFQSYFIYSIYKMSSPKLKDGVLRIDSIAVDSSFRSLGIGTKLINRVFEFAKTRGFREVILEVVDTNPRAKDLYERIGFKQKKIIRYYFLTRPAGFSSEYIMSYIL